MERVGSLKGIIQKNHSIEKPVLQSLKFTEWNMLAGSLSDQGAFPKVSQELLDIE